MKDEERKIYIYIYQVIPREISCFCWSEEKQYIFETIIFIRSKLLFILLFLDFRNYYLYYQFQILGFYLQVEFQIIIIQLQVKLVRLVSTIISFEINLLFFFIFQINIINRIIITFLKFNSQNNIKFVILVHPFIFNIFFYKNID